jgi:hypothetical protein
MQFCQILESYLTERSFRVKYKNEYFVLKKISAGVPQSSVLGPVLYLLYTRDIPQDVKTTIATFVDDTAIMATEKTIEEVTKKLQRIILSVSKWTKKWRIKLNEAKLTHINFTNKKINSIPIKINEQAVLIVNSAQYLGMTLDAKLR